MPSKLLVTEEMRTIHFEKTGMYCTDEEILQWFIENIYVSTTTKGEK